MPTEKASPRHHRTHVEFPAGNHAEPIVRDARERQGPVINLAPRVLCKNCNNEWISGLDNAVKPIVQPLMQRSVLVVSPIEQELAAAWIVAKLMAIEPHYGNTVTTQTERAAFRSSCKAPDNWSVWLAAYARSKVDNFLLRVPVAVTTNGHQSTAFNTQFIVWTMGRLMIIAVSAPRGVQFAMPSDARAVMMQLHPGGVDIHWPPAGEVTRPEIEEFFTSQCRMLRTLSY